MDARVTAEYRSIMPGDIVRLHPSANGHVLSPSGALKPSPSNAAEIFLSIDICAKLTWHRQACQQKARGEWYDQDILF